MVQCVITPWRRRAELLRVRSQLYPEDVPSMTIPRSAQMDPDVGRREAVARVAIWMQRGNCPHVVQSTAILTSALLNDDRENEAYCVRAVYAAAFSRFVTGLLDCQQDKRHKLSMYSIAKTIGLPATFVELRHQATHEELPSLPRLRSATHKALRWIWNYYWINLSQEDDQVDECEGVLKQLLSEDQGQSNLKLIRLLRKWPEEQVMQTILQIQDTTHDTTILLRAAQLQTQMLHGSTSSPETKDLDKVRAEVELIKKQLSDDQAEVLDQSGDVGVDGSSQGWSMWQGPWIPRPIGVV